MRDVTLTTRPLSHAQGDRVWQVRDHGEIVAERFSIISEEEAEDIVSARRLMVQEQAKLAAAEQQRSKGAKERIA